MSTHKNARLTFRTRLEMVEDITERCLSASEAAGAHSVSATTARKWLGRYLAHGVAALADKSSRPALSPRAIDPSVALATANCVESCSPSRGSQPISVFPRPRSAASCAELACRGPADLPGFFVPIVLRQSAPRPRGDHEKRSIHRRADGRDPARG